MADALVRKDKLKSVDAKQLLLKMKTMKKRITTSLRVSQSFHMLREKCGGAEVSDDAAIDEMRSQIYQIGIQAEESHSDSMSSEEDEGKDARKD